MYKAAVRALVRHGIRCLNEGDSEFLLRLCGPNPELAFPGDNSWASMFRPVVKGRECHVTHRGVDECRAFADRFVANQIQSISPTLFLATGMPTTRKVRVSAPRMVKQASKSTMPWTGSSRRNGFPRCRLASPLRMDSILGCERDFNRMMK